MKLRFSNARTIRASLARVANAVANGQIEPKQANAIIYASTAILQSIRVDEQQKRLEALERSLEEIRG